MASSENVTNHSGLTSNTKLHDWWELSSGSGIWFYLIHCVGKRKYSNIPNWMSILWCHHIRNAIIKMLLDFDLNDYCWSKSDKSCEIILLCLMLFCVCRWFSGARWPWWLFATLSSARRFTSHTKPQRADLTLPIAKPKQKSLWWWGCFSSALPPFILHAFPTPWPRLAAWWAIAEHKTHFTSPRKPPSGCRPPTYAWTRLSMCSCVRCSGKNWQPPSAVSLSTKEPWSPPQ